jgi:2'-5' RNA ligase
MRTFIAIDLDPAIKATLADFLKRLRKVNDRDISWSSLEGLHLTLKFLGEVQPEKVDRVKDTLVRLIPSFPTFPLVLKGTGYFPNNTKFIRVLWAGVFEQPNLMNLQREIVFHLQNQGFLSEEHPFHPHLTLGRVKSVLKLADVLNELERYQYSDFGQMTVSKITLFESRLLPSGAVYKPLAEFFLS